MTTKSILLQLTTSTRRAFKAHLRHRIFPPLFLNLLVSQTGTGVLWRLSGAPTTRQVDVCEALKQVRGRFLPPTRRKERYPIDIFACSSSSADVTYFVCVGHKIRHVELEGDKIQRFVRKKCR